MAESRNPRRDGGKPAGRDASGKGAGGGRGGKPAGRGGRDQRGSGEPRRDGKPADARGAKPAARRDGKPTTPRRDGKPYEARRDRRQEEGDRTAAQKIYDGPPIPDDVSAKDLDKHARQALQALPEKLADKVARHLVMAGLLIAEDPETAHKHALAARARATRTGLVREACGETAYACGKWAEALSEFRAARRMTGGYIYAPMMADCERALKRPEQFGDSGLGEVDPDALKQFGTAFGLGMDPEEVGEKTVQGIRENKGLILTHPEHGEDIQEIYETTMAALPKEEASAGRLHIERLRREGNRAAAAGRKIGLEDLT